MFRTLIDLFTGRMDREEEADFRRCVLGQTDTEIEAAMGKEVAAQALADVDARHHEARTLRQRRQQIPW